MNPLKKIYWFSFYHLSSPTVRYRGKYTTDFFTNNYGIKTELILPGHHLSSVLRFIRVYISALFSPRKGSLIVIQSVYRKSFYPTLLKILVKLRPGICFYDLDDADYLRYPPATIYYFLKNCKAVTVGSTELVKNLTRYNANTFLVTCPVPDLGIAKPTKNKILTLGWIGDFQKTHKQSLIASFFPALIHLPFPIHLILMGVVKPEEYEFLQSYFQPYTHITLEIPREIDWLNETAIQQKISTFDIGIATLLDDEFSRSKSAFKLKQCLNNGVPVLSSNIAENSLFIDPGKNGFLCDTPADFHQRILEIEAMTTQEYQQLCTYARNSHPRFNLTHFCEEYIKTYNQVTTR
jgi:glycosyltransferase involved in cell wall biosynthesis